MDVNGPSQRTQNDVLWGLLCESRRDKPFDALFREIAPTSRDLTASAKYFVGQLPVVA